MTNAQVGYRLRPCAGCPWRTDVDLGAFRVADVATLCGSNGVPGGEATVPTPAMACHQERSPVHTTRWCAGWLAVVGGDHLVVLMAVVAGHLPTHALVASEHWPQPHDSLEARLAHRATARR